MSPEEQERAILDMLHEGVYTVDRDRRITYWNTAAERITDISAGDACGHLCSENLLVHVDAEGVRLCDGFCPIKQAISTGEAVESHMFLRHGSGHRVPVNVRVAPLRNGAGEITGAAQAFSERVALCDIDDPIGELECAALIDDLTGLANRRMIRSALETKFAEMDRYRWRFGVLFLDIDHFKQVNDRHGHEVGDDVLKVVANTLLSNVRSLDIAGRWGGEEFLVLVSNVGEEELHSIADRFRVLIGQSSVPVDGEELHATVSIGATLAIANDDARSLIRRADRLMYDSKRAGRNRVSTGTAA